MTSLVHISMRTKRVTAYINTYISSIEDLCQFEQTVESNEHTILSQANGHRQMSMVQASEHTVKHYAHSVQPYAHSVQPYAHSVQANLQDETVCRVY